MVGCSDDPNSVGSRGWNPNAVADGGVSMTGAGNGSAASGAPVGNGNGNGSGSGAGGRTSTAGSGTSTGTAATGSWDDACAATKQEAQEIPIDMYIMLDRSSSMDESTGTGATKWNAVRSALRSFLSDSRSDGLGVGLQFFPIATAGVPETCTTSAECGATGGSCLVGVCEPTNQTQTQAILCSIDTDCPGSRCITDVGYCQSDSSLLCLNVGVGGCGFLDDCLPLQLGSCSKAYSCDATEYATPSVEIATLPGNSNALVTTLDAERTLGSTPTSAALSGALARAKEYAASQPTHRVIAVLATDGLPTECPPTDAASIASIAQTGQAGTPPVSTYVIGVFSRSDTGAKTNLDSWAVAGGTKQAFIIDPSSDVGAQFLDALDEIRSGTIACEYQVPAAPTGGVLDFSRVNVALIEGQNTTDFLYVGDEGRCNSADYGWYYDVDPAAGTPTKIVVCSQACTALKSTTATSRVEVRLGCVSNTPD